MREPDIPADEVDRLESLQSYGVLDTPNDTQFDDITLLATILCNSAVALISLVDEKRQWFKSQRGFDLPEIGREFSFCGHKILGAALMEVQDALDDIRFHDNPFVVGGPCFRFYAGVPLVDRGGHHLGTLCVLDYVPRALTEIERAALEALSRVAMQQLDLQKIQLQHNASVDAAAKSEQRIRTITDNLPALVSFVDINERYQFCNAHYRTLLGLEPNKMIGKSLRQVYGEKPTTICAARFKRLCRASACHSNASLKKMANLAITSASIFPKLA